jgi:hypothetical protein
MVFDKRLLIFLIILFFISISVVSASDANSTGTVDLPSDDSLELNENDVNSNLQESEDVDLSSNDVSKLNGDTPNQDSGNNKLDICEDADLSSDDNLELNEDKISQSPANHKLDNSQNSVLLDNGSSKNGIVNDNNQKEGAEKTTPKISIKSTHVKSKDTLEFYLKNSDKKPLKGKKLIVFLNNHKYSIKTNSKGIAKLNINLNAKSYNLKVTFKEDKKYNSVSKSFKIKVSKIGTKILPLTNFVLNGDYLEFYLYDNNLNPLKGKRVAFKIIGKKYAKTTNRNGLVKFKIDLPKSKYVIHAKFKGDKQYKKSSKTLKFHIVKSMYFKLRNYKLLTKGYLRVHLKNVNVVGKRTVTVYIGDKKISKKTNSEGIAVFKPNVGEDTYKVTVKMGKYRIWKKLVCYKGKVKDPLKYNITFRHGYPDIDVMPGNYVAGDENGRYTLTKSQYRDVLKRDSYCLFMFNKLPKYTFFKTKSHPKLNHIVKREKWNVIEREINERLVDANKPGYWPGEVTVSLKGRAYVYPEVRDVQDTSYTCGPTSCSVCSQVLKNYVCEKYLAKLAGSKPVLGTPCNKMIKSLEKNNFVCKYFYKASFKDALRELKNGGTALVFHAENHYVSIIDISNDGKKVLVSNSYGSYDNIPTKWIKVSYMKTKFSHWEESLIVKLNYKLKDSKKRSVNCYYNSFGANWHRHSTGQKIGRA